MITSFFAAKPKAGPLSPLSEEQKQKMEANRLKALEKLSAKKTGAVPAQTDKPPLSASANTNAAPVPMDESSGPVKVKLEKVQSMQPSSGAPAQAEAMVTTSDEVVAKAPETVKSAEKPKKRAIQYDSDEESGMRLEEQAPPSSPLKGGASNNGSATPGKSASKRSPASAKSTKSGAKSPKTPKSKTGSGKEAKSSQQKKRKRKANDDEDFVAGSSDESEEDSASDAASSSGSDGEANDSGDDSDGGAKKRKSKKKSGKSKIKAKSPSKSKKKAAASDSDADSDDGGKKGKRSASKPSPRKRAKTDSSKKGKASASKSSGSAAKTKKASSETTVAGQTLNAFFNAAKLPAAGAGGETKTSPVRVKSEPKNGDDNAMDTGDGMDDGEGPIFVVLAINAGGADKPKVKQPSPEDTAPWLKPDKIMDKQKRRPNHPQYDARTLHVPDDAFKKMTPAQKQYWLIKRDNFDVVLFFKMGKFYELFDADAELGVRHLGLAYMKNQARPHAGFPEAAYNKYAEQLVALGYKVGRVEQTETPEQLKEANSELGKGSKRKVVDRKMCSILTRGTLTDPELIGHDEANWILSLCEDEKTQQYGVCFVDTATAQFNVGQFTDDRQKARLRTLIAQTRPEELVYCKDQLSQSTRSILRTEVRSTCLKEEVPRAEMWDMQKVLSTLRDPKYFSNGDGKDGKESKQDMSTGEDEPDRMPDALKQLAHENQSLAFNALGGCLRYLTRLQLDRQLVSLGLFRVYDPSLQSGFLVLDGQTLQNLEVLENGEGGKEGTLLAHIDHCQTAFGRRLLRTWISRPLGRIAAIEERLNAVEDFMQNSELADKISPILKKLPDVERLLSRIHANSLVKDHAEVMYGEVDKAKLMLFLKVVGGMEETRKVIAAFDADSLRSKRLRHLVTVGAGFPDMSEELDYFKSAFDHKLAKESGFVIPFPGMDPEYDELAEKEKQCSDALQEHLEKQRKYFKDKKIKYIDKAKERFQLEISNEALEGVKLPNSFEEKSRTTKCRRFWTPEIVEMVPQLEEAEYNKAEMLKDYTRRIFVRFCKSYALWTQAVNCIAEIDCIASLARTSAYRSGPSSRPVFVSMEDTKGEPFIELRGAVHPGLMDISVKNFIPNDTVLGTAENKPKFVLVSGPNMGGKSTLLRQTCAAVILAHLGCYVPADSCKLTPIDRIFTRVGANDRIMQGQSTFLVELEETANILRHATNRSLVILDELGRGTSTFDGTAIAYAVIQYLTQKGCLTLFSTHYHMLMEEFAKDSRVAMYHMAAELSRDQSEVMMLYKFKQGTCPKSYGMNVARLADLPESVVQRARLMSEMFEARLEQAHGMRKNTIRALDPEDTRLTSPKGKGSKEPVSQDLVGLVEKARAALASKNVAALHSLQALIQQQL